MPIYEARCKECGTKFSYLSKVADRHITGNCPQCDGVETEQVLSATRTDFKFADRSPFK